MLLREQCGNEANFKEKVLENQTFRYAVENCIETIFEAIIDAKDKRLTGERKAELLINTTANVILKQKRKRLAFYWDLSSFRKPISHAFSLQHLSAQNDLMHNVDELNKQVQYLDDFNILFDKWLTKLSKGNPSIIPQWQWKGLKSEELTASSDNKLVEKAKRAELREGFDHVCELNIQELSEQPKKADAVNFNGTDKQSQTKNKVEGKQNESNQQQFIP